MRDSVGDVDIVVGTANGLGAITRNEIAAIRGIGHRGPIALPRLLAGECFGGNEALAHVLALSAAEPGQTLLVTVSTVNGGVTSALVRKADLNARRTSVCDRGDARDRPRHR